MLDLSVIIVSYNTAPLLQACLESVLASLRRSGGKGTSEGQESPFSYEIWVVDNASRDGSAAMVRDAFPEVHLLENGTNRGFAAANNQAMAQSQGRHLLLLNPDTVLLGDAVGELRAFLQDHPDVGVVCGKLLYPDGTFQHSAFRFPNLWMSFLDFFPLNHRLLHSALNGRYSARAYRAPFAIDHPLGACMMVRRQALEQVGGLSPEFFMYCEEIDWCLRMKRAGWRVYCQPKAQIVHYGGQSTKQFREAMFVELHRSRLRLFRKHYPPAFRLAARLIVALGLVWELTKARRSLRQGAMDQPQYQARIHACRAVGQLLLHHA